MFPREVRYPAIVEVNAHERLLCVGFGVELVSRDYAHIWPPGGQLR